MVKWDSRQRALASIVLCAVLTLGGVELTCWTFFSLNRTKFLFRDPAHYVASPDQIKCSNGNNSPRYCDMRTTFDAGIGWIKDYGTKYNERPGELPPEQAIMSVFGGSFAVGGEVNDSDAASEGMSALLGQRVLNFGVSMYSIDQALLLFERKLKEIRTPLSMLMFTTYNLGELVNVYNRFYYPPSQNAVTKPRFEILKGSLRLIPNPIQRFEDRIKLTDPDFVGSIGQLDWWYTRNDLPWFGFPYTGILFDHRFWRQISFDHGIHISENMPTVDDEVLAHPPISDIASLVLRRFVADAKQNGVTPILTILPFDHEIVRFRHGRYPPVHTKIKTACAEEGWVCLTPLDAIDEIFPGRVQDYFAAHGHYNAKGEAAMARWMVAELMRRQVVPLSSQSHSAAVQETVH
jgi:hypothetical protein